MANYQVLFNGEVAGTASVDVVRDNLARELGLDDRKAKQLFSGRTVVIRSQLDQTQAQAWQDKLAQFGAVCRIKDLTPKDDKATFPAGKGDSEEHTLRDITAAHLECPVAAICSWTRAIVRVVVSTWSKHSGPSIKKT